MLFSQLCLRVAPAGVALSQALSAPCVAAADEMLPVGPNGVAYIQTESGHTLCGVQADEVNCSVHFLQRPHTASGDAANSVTLNQNGGFTYLAADLGMVEPLHHVRYDQTYIVNGWVVQPYRDGTRFTSVVHLRT